MYIAKYWFSNAFSASKEAPAIFGLLCNGKCHGINKRYKSANSCEYFLISRPLNNGHLILTIFTNKMIYGYIRVSTDKQTVENQRFEINQFALKNNLVIEKWIEETISGTKEVDKRTLGKLLKKTKKDDILICSELSRLGRSLFMIMEVLNFCMKREVKIWTIKDNYRLGEDIQSKVLAFAFGLSAEIERNLISQRTKEALARKKAEGVILGRPIGSKSSKVKLSGKELQVQKLLNKNISYSAIGRILGVNRITVTKFAKERILINWITKIYVASYININVKNS